MRPVGGAVKRFAAERNLLVLQPENFKTAQAVQQVCDIRPDALVVAAYGLILPPPLLQASRHGAFNIHASLLPRWRGAAPIQRALLAGDTETGICIMKMDAGLDTGPVLARRAIPIAATDDAGTLHDKLAELGAEMIVATLADVEAGRSRAVPQREQGVTYARKIGKQETVLDWSRPAVELARVVRAFRPSPGAVTLLDGEPIKIWRARVVERLLPPGTVANDLVVGCGEGALAIDELQRAGGKRLSAAEFLRGRPLPTGAHFT
jgi:methionyl-tRNA formyltransferase